MKAAVYTLIYIQLIFSPKYKESLLQKEHRKVVLPYIGKTIANLDHYPIITNGMSDHIHILFALNPKQSISELVRDVKRASSLFINEQSWFPGKFQWQDGYGAFSYGKSQLNNVYNYVENQERHHSKLNFREEYTSLLKLFGVEYKDEYLFKFH